VGGLAFAWGRDGEGQREKFLVAKKKNPLFNVTKENSRGNINPSLSRDHLRTHERGVKKSRK